MSAKKLEVKFISNFFTNCYTKLKFLKMKENTSFKGERLIIDPITIGCSFVGYRSYLFSKPTVVAFKDKISKRSLLISEKCTTFRNAANVEQPQHSLYTKSISSS